MYKALMKKQLLETSSRFFVDRKSGKTRSGSKKAIFVLLYVFLYSMLSFMFMSMGMMTCRPLVSSGLGWLYFDLFVLMSLLFGIIGSVFTTYSTLYSARDNDLLLSMPIKPSAILITRLFGVWLWGFINESIVLIPSMIVYLVVAAGEKVLSPAAIPTGILMWLAESVIILSLSCVLGYVVAKINSHIRKKSFITVLVSLVGMAAYYIVVTRMYELLEMLMANAAKIGEKIKEDAYFFYLLGASFEGGVLQTLVLTLISCAFFIAVFLVLNKSFLRIATTNKGAARIKAKQVKYSAKSPAKTLIGKEIRRFASSPNYILNSGIGAIILLVCGIAMLIKGNDIAEMISFVGVAQYKSLLAAAVICMISMTVEISSVSISLEGNKLWILKSMPVSAGTILLSKVAFHLLIAEIPAVICAVLVGIGLGLSVYETVLIILTVVSFVLLSAVSGLLIDLRSPNLDWTNEIIPLKQNTSIMIGMFGGWVLIVVLAVIYFLLRSVITPAVYLIIISAAMILADALLVRRMLTRGAKKFETL